MFDKLIFAMGVGWELTVKTFPCNDAIKYILIVTDENGAEVERAKWLPGFTDDAMDIVIRRVEEVAASPVV